MAEQKEGYLNESYFGPTIPPQEPTPRRLIPRKNWSPYYLLCAIIRTTVVIIIGIGIVVLILWLIYQPDKLKVYVENANLTRFDLAPNNNTLYYNLNVNMSIRNPNAKVGIYYEKIEAMAFYSGSRFSYKMLPRFHQRKKNTSIVQPSFAGQALMVGDSVRSTYDREKGEGWFWVNVMLYTKVRLRMIVINSVEYQPDVNCQLRLPVPSNASSVAAGFLKTECHVDDFS